MASEPKSAANTDDPPAAEVGRHPARFSRRTLLAAAATGAAVLAGCAPDASTARAPTPTVRPFALGRAATVGGDTTVTSALIQVAARLLGGNAGIPSATPIASASAKPDLLLTFGTVPAGYVGIPVGKSLAALLTHLRVPVDAVSTDQARGLLAGDLRDWQAVGAPYSVGARVVTLAGVPIPEGVRLATGARQVSSATELLSTLRDNPGSLALAPAEVADWSVKNVGVDGLYPAQGRGDPSRAGLPLFTLTLGVSAELARAGLDARAAAQALLPLLSWATPTLDMVVVGDIMLGRGVNNKMVTYGDYLYPYRKIRDEFRSADLRVANLECTITDLVPVPTDPATFTFVSAKRAVDGLTYAGLDILTVANNHSNGSGPTAFLDMLNTLQTHGIATTGGGHTLAEARKPAIRTAKGRRVAILGYDIISPQGPFATDTSPGIAPVDLTTLPQDLAAAREQADLVIPYFHWGIEYTKDPTSEQQHIAHAAIDAGADMVLGNHPHWVQAIESYKGRLIIYSFGNFIFDQDWSRPTMEGLMIHLYWRGTTLASMRIVPVIDQDRCQPRPMSVAEAVDVFDRMWSGTDMLARGQYGPEPE